jgi:hypothetical protein
MKRALGLLLSILVIVVAGIAGSLIGQHRAAVLEAERLEAACLNDPFCSAAREIEAQLGYVDVLWIRRSVSASGQQILTIGLTMNPQFLVRTGEEGEIFSDVLWDALRPVAEGATVLVVWLDELPLDDNVWDAAIMCTAMVPLPEGQSVLDVPTRCLTAMHMRLSNPDSVYMWVGRHDPWFRGSLQVTE